MRWSDTEEAWKRRKKWEEFEEQTPTRWCEMAHILRNRYFKKENKKILEVNSTPIGTEKWKLLWCPIIGKVFLDFSFK